MYTDTGLRDINFKTSCGHLVSVRSMTKGSRAGSASAVAGRPAPAVIISEDASSLPAAAVISPLPLLASIADRPSTVVCLYTLCN